MFIYFFLKNRNSNKKVIFGILVGISFPGLATQQKCSIGTTCTIKCNVIAGDKPDIDWLTKDGIINFQSGSEIFTLEILQSFRTF